MVHILGVLGPISGPHCSGNKWSTSFRSIKIEVSEEFSEASFQRGVQSFRCLWCFGPKKGFAKSGKNCLFTFCSGGCCFMILLDCKKGGGANPLKQGFLPRPS